MNINIEKRLKAVEIELCRRDLKELELKVKNLKTYLNRSYRTVNFERLTTAQVKGYEANLRDLAEYKGRITILKEILGEK